jgi:hypothetical protein
MTVPAWQSSSKKSLPGAAVFNGFFPGFASWLLTDDHIDAVITHVKRLSRTLDAVPQYRYHLILQHLAGFFQGELITSDDLFFDAAKFIVAIIRSYERFTTPLQSLGGDRSC